MARFSFEVCQANQVDDLVAYIDSHWVKNHILVTSRTLLDWQHKNKQGDYNFVMARDNRTNEVCGGLGFIPTSHYSSALDVHKEAWLAIWKVNEGPRYIGLGLGLLNYLKREFSITTICSIGISQIVFPMYQALGFEVGKLNQMALINTTRNDQVLTEFPKNFQTEPQESDSVWELKDISDDDILSVIDYDYLYSNHTVKNKEYFLNRFIKHPKFKYRFLAIYNSGTIKAFLVIRVVEHNTATAVKVVDIQGDLSSISHVSGLLYDFIVKEQHEYIDIMQYGMNEVALIDAGFVRVGDNEEVIVPEYYQPFVKKNISICFARKTDSMNDEFVLFKGDADQDRPNVM
ncbi:hypothetical protein VVNSV5830_00831 [Vibrio vulnificus]|uniref:hypothetical protein n=1 Tax=Vibrio vulnificus TaxID=672 RepID=UPI000928A752|nr:hypothetical protein [Vibrio vulnificus]OJI28255.1 hypothetical protein VVNSV5830_00831 [Vibrio vulnificus]